MDLFSGTGGFHAGLEDSGLHIKKVYFSEIDKHAIANYKFNFPYAQYIGPVEESVNQTFERPNIITFGSPCQDFSIAGKREGLSGAKSSLIEQAIATITHYRPDVFIWENVKGAFTSNNREDFWAIIQAFANIGNYDIEWQLVNTAWILPQIESGFTLSDILENPSEIGEKYFLSQRSTEYLLRKLNDPRGFKPRFAVQSLPDTEVNQQTPTSC